MEAVCAVCSDPVDAEEAVELSDTVVVHGRCARCAVCAHELNVLTAHAREGRLFCVHHVPIVGDADDEAALAALRTSWDADDEFSLDADDDGAGELLLATSMGDESSPLAARAAMTQSRGVHAELEHPSAATESDMVSVVFLDDDTAEPRDPSSRAPEPPNDAREAGKLGSDGRLRSRTRSMTREPESALFAPRAARPRVSGTGSAVLPLAIAIHTVRRPSAAQRKASVTSAPTAGDDWGNEDVSSAGGDLSARDDGSAGERAVRPAARAPVFAADTAALARLPHRSTSVMQSIERATLRLSRAMAFSSDDEGNDADPDSGDNDERLVGNAAPAADVAAPAAAVASATTPERAAAAATAAPRLFGAAALAHHGPILAVARKGTHHSRHKRMSRAMAERIEENFERFSLYDSPRASIVDEGVDSAADERRDAIAGEHAAATAAAATPVSGLAAEPAAGGVGEYARHEIDSNEPQLVLGAAGGGRQFVKAGTVARLVEHVASAPDPEFAQTFMLTYRSFLLPTELFERLAARFDGVVPPDSAARPARARDASFGTESSGTTQSTPPSGESSPPTGGGSGGRATGALVASGADGSAGAGAARAGAPDQLLPVRIRVCNVFKMWMESYAFDFDAQPELLARLAMFFTRSVAPVLPSLASRLGVYVTKLQSGQRIVRHFNTETLPPAPLLPASFGGSITHMPTRATLTLADVSPLEFARQLTVVESALFRSIQPWECLNKAWSRSAHDAPSILALAQRFNLVSHFVAVSVVADGGSTPRARASVLKWFIQAAGHCAKLANFNGLMEILSGLHSSAVHRLRRSWASLPKSAVLLHERLSALVSRDSNFKAMRAVLRFQDPPCLPYLGLMLSDLTFIEDGMPDTVNARTAAMRAWTLSSADAAPRVATTTRAVASRAAAVAHAGERDPLPDTARVRGDGASGEGATLVNFAKLRRIAIVIKGIQSFQLTPYALTPVSGLQRWVEDVPAMTDSELYAKSLELEPRGAT